MRLGSSHRTEESIIEEIQQSMSSSSGEKLSYKDAREITDTQYTLADIAIDMYLESREHDLSDSNHESDSGENIISCGDMNP